MKFAFYVKLEARIKKGDLDALLLRWEFGRQANGDNAEYKHGEWSQVRDQMASDLAICAAELKNRMQFATEYPTKAEAKEAFAQFGSWTTICEQGLGERGATIAAASSDDPPLPRFAHGYLAAANQFLAAAKRAAERAERLTPVQQQIEDKHLEIREAIDKLEQALAKKQVA